MLFAKTVIKKAEKRIIERLRGRYVRIHLTPAQGLFNYKCFHNCVQWVFNFPRVDNPLEVVEVIYIDEWDRPLLHYVIRDPAADPGREFLDVSLGYLCAKYECYLIRKIHPAEYDNISNIFQSALDDWLHEFVPGWLRFITRVDRIL